MSKTTRIVAIVCATVLVIAALVVALLSGYQVSFSEALLGIGSFVTGVLGTLFLRGKDSS